MSERIIFDIRCFHGITDSFRKNYSVITGGVTG
jgi:hypothetical protein